MPRYFSSIKSSFESRSSLPNPQSRRASLVQHLGKGLGQPVGQGLGHDGVVIVVVALRTARPGRRCRPRS